jgi:hypothetical protein
MRTRSIEGKGKEIERIWSPQRQFDKNTGGRTK